jgi:hypothetical protein
MVDQTNQSDFDPVEAHWDADWVEESVARNVLPVWLAVFWVIFALWAILYLIDSASSW